MPLGFPPSLLGLRVSGDVAGLTVYTDRRGINVWYKAVVPQKPPTAAQVVQRARFAQAMDLWSTLTLEERHAYRMACDRLSLCMLGHNLWIIVCMLPDDQLWETLCRQTRLQLALPIHV